MKKLGRVLSLAVVAVLGLSVAQAEVNISSGPLEKSFTRMADNLVGKIGKDATGVSKAKNLNFFTLLIDDITVLAHFIICNFRILLNCYLAYTHVIPLVC